MTRHRYTSPGEIKVSMLRLVLRLARRARVKVAVGGGIAVCAHGYRRETSDVDAFFHYEDRQKVLRALHRVAPEYQLESLDQSHWVAVPPGAAVDQRIDLLFATGDPEESAVEMAEMKTYEGVRAPVFPVEWLVVCKYLAERDEPKDWLDIYVLHQRGAYAIKDVVRRLRQMGRPNEAASFPRFMARLASLKDAKK